MSKIIGTATAREIESSFSVYILRDYQTAEIVFVGVLPYSQTMSFSDARKCMGDWFPEYFIWEIIGVCDSRVEALNLQSRSIAQFKLIEKMASYANQTAPRCVICVDTGEVFESCKAAADAHGIDVGNLSRHLRSQPGFKTVKGKIYKIVKNNVDNKTDQA